MFTDRLAEITLSHCTIPNVSAPATGRRGDHVPRDQNKSEQTDGEEMLGPLAIDSSQDQAVYDQSEVNFITSDLAVKLQNFCKHLGVWRWNHLFLSSLILNVVFERVYNVIAI